MEMSRTCQKHGRISTISLIKKAFHPIGSKPHLHHRTLLPASHCQTAAGPEGGIEAAWVWHVSLAETHSCRQRSPQRSIPCHPTACKKPVSNPQGQWNLTPLLVLRVAYLLHHTNTHAWTQLPHIKAFFTGFTLMCFYFVCFLVWFWKELKRKISQERRISITLGT